jgi:small subunit ribosomal protein S6
MDKAQRMYETTFIVNASLDDSQVDAVIGRVQDIITKNGGVISALNKWGRKRLAYSINKKTNGFYVNIEFSGPNGLPTTLERSFQLDEMILRSLLITLDRKALAVRAAAALAQAQAPVPEPAATVPVREPLFGETPEEKRS